MSSVMNIREPGTYYVVETLRSRYGVYGVEVWVEDTRYYTELDEARAEARDAGAASGWPARVARYDVTKTVVTG